MILPAEICFVPLLPSAICHSKMRARLKKDHKVGFTSVKDEKKLIKNKKSA